MMEKAWAKIHGSYDRIVSGTVYLTLRDLTGAPGFQISDIKKEENLFEKIKNWDNNNYMMSASIHAQQTSEMKENGLITMHAYSLIQAEVVVKDKKKI